MIVTPLKLFRLPHTYAKRLRNEVDSSVSIHLYLKVDDFVDRLNGKVVHIGYMNPYYPDFEDDMTADVDVSTIKIECDNGECVGASRRSLMRRFHFFDDYLTAFPDVTTVKLPFDRDVVHRSLLRSVGRLVDCYECIRFCNPKDIRHYFIFDTAGSTREILKSITSQLTERDRREMLEAGRHGRIVPPYEGMGLGIIAQALVAHCDYNNLKELFSDCPSYLFSVLPPDLRLPLLYTEDFSNEYASCDSHMEMVLILLEALNRANTKEDMRRIMTMMGIVHKIFDNEDDYIPLPYNMDIKLYSIPGWRSSSIIDRISKAFSIEPTTISAVFDSLK